MAVKKRRLGDLFMVEKALTINDGKGEDITVLIRKLAPPDQDMVFRRANAARARVLADKKNTDSDAYQSCVNDATDLGRQGLLDLVCAERLTQERQLFEAQVSHEEEWTKDEYLQGLTDAWGDGLNVRFATEPEDEDAKRVFAELKRFYAQIDERLDYFKAELFAQYEQKSDEELLASGVERLMRMQGDIAWLMEYRKSSIWRMVMDPDTGKRYFEHREEVDPLANEVMSKLIEAIENLEVDVMEGKDSQETEVSSTSSETQDQQETA